MKSLFKALSNRPTVIGTGLITLDIVLNQGSGAGPQVYAGGTCGNVLAILGFLGWDVRPLARLNEDAAATQVRNDLKRWGVSLDFIGLSPCANAPIIVQEIKQNAQGHSYHKFSWICPQCGAWLPSYKAVLANAIKNIADELPVPMVFFFDRVSRGALILAEKYRDSGSLIFFEPSGVANVKQFKEAVQLAHIVKYAEDRGQHFKELIGEFTPLLEIETLSKRGLRYRTSLNFSRNREWLTLSPFETEIVDTAGAGDWCSAGIINALGHLGFESLNNLSMESLINGLRIGQAMASWTCTFEGPRGGMYQADFGQFDRYVKSKLQNGKDFEDKRNKQTHAHSKHVFKCPSCKDSRLVNRLSQ